MAPTRDGVGCVAFCFLTRELPLQSELWYEFFAEGERAGLPFTVVVHAKRATPEDASPEHVARHWFAERCMARPVATEWGTVSLVSATLALWREALEREPRTTHLCLLSESCAPLCGFAECWREVVALRRTTFDARPPGESRDRFEKMADLTLVSAENRRKQSQWFVASAVDAAWFVANDWTARWGSEAFGADEHYFISLMAEHGRPFDSRPTTFNDWGWRARFPHARPHVDDETERSWLPHVFDRVGAGTIATLRGERFLFLRKVAAGAVVELDLATS